MIVILKVIQMKLTFLIFRQRHGREWYVQEHPRDGAIFTPRLKLTRNCTFSVEERTFLDKCSLIKIFIAISKDFPDQFMVFDELFRLKYLDMVTLCWHEVPNPTDDPPGRRSHASFVFKDKM